MGTAEKTVGTLLTFRMIVARASALPIGGADILVTFVTNAGTRPTLIFFDAEADRLVNPWLADGCRIWEIGTIIRTLDGRENTPDYIISLGSLVFDPSTLAPSGKPRLILVVPTSVTTSYAAGNEATGRLRSSATSKPPKSSLNG